VVNILNTFENTSLISFEEKPLLTFKDNRRLITQIKDLSLASIREINSRWERKYNPLKGCVRDIFPSIKQENTGYDVDDQLWEKSTKLVVFIHGLNCSPLAWSKYFNEISSKTISCFTPFVYKKGYCKLEEAVDPILNVVQRYAEKHSENPIIIVGHSNGARIAAHIEQKLNAKNIRLISIAGPHCGSLMINNINKFGLNRFFGITSDMEKELTYNGEWVKEKLQEWYEVQKQYKNKKVERVFFASVDDLRIFPNETSFPNLPSSTYHIVSGQSHVTIIDAVKPPVLFEIFKD